MDDKITYQMFSARQYVPLFSKPWWLDAVCGKNNWDVWLYQNGNEILAAMPYRIKQDRETKQICRAPISQNNGILIAYPKAQKYCSRLDYEDKILNRAIDYIESLGLASYQQQFHYSFTNWLPFFWRGYDGLLRYTYVIEDTHDMEYIESNFDAKLRNQIRKAQKLLQVDEGLSASRLYELNCKTYFRQGRETMPHTFETLDTLISTCKTHGCYRILYAADTCKNIHGAILLVWDEQSVYYILSGSDPEYRSSQANSLLIYEGIKLASQMGLKFDFEGSVVKQIENNFRQFGGIRKPYFRISKDFREVYHNHNMVKIYNGGGGAT